MDAEMYTEVKKLPPDVSAFIERLVAGLDDLRESDTKHQMMLRNTQAFMDRMKDQIQEMHRQILQLNESLKEKDNTISFYREMLSTTSTPPPLDH